MTHISSTHLTAENIPKMNVKQLIKDMVLQSSILAFVNFKDIMISNPNFTYFEILSRLLQLALEKHEAYIPNYKRSQIYIQPNSSSYVFKDNFDAFLDCKISEKSVTLIPKTSPYNVDSSLLHGRRSWIYDRPVMREVYISGILEVNYVTYYPTRFKHVPEEDDFTEDSAIYYMGMYGSSTGDEMFKRQFYLQILIYLKGVKNNLRYPDMPIELLQGIEEEYQIVMQELQEFYRKSNTHGRLYR